MESYLIEIPTSRIDVYPDRMAHEFFCIPFRKFYLAKNPGPARFRLHAFEIFQGYGWNKTVLKLFWSDRHTFYLYEMPLL